jgi:Na+/H+ antiporter
VTTARGDRGRAAGRTTNPEDRLFREHPCARHAVATLLQILPVLTAMLAVLALGSVIAPRLRVPQPVLLALCGIGLVYVPGLKQRELDPDLILVLFLPPLLYADTFATSWVDFRRWIRPILMLAVGLVAATILAVGLTAHAFLPDLPWAVCFVLGAIVSPTDTVAVSAVIERLRIPRRATAILGGESLVNDATGLVGVQIGVAVVLSGAFEAREVLGQFAWTAGGGVAIGLAVGVLFAWLNRIVRETQALFAISLIAPYLAFGIAHALGSSGVLAVVVAGFVVAWRIHVVPAQARIELYTTWGLLVSVLNGLCFVFIGLETPRLIRATPLGLRNDLVLAGLAVSATVVLVRFVWMFPGAYVPPWFSPRLRAREGGYPSWTGVVLAAWCGIRGVISLAAALSLPAVLPDGRAFPGHDAVLACTLCVILVTLFLQATTIHPLIHWLGLREEEDGDRELHAARRALLRASIARLDAFCKDISCPVAVHRWRELLVDELAEFDEEDAEARALAKSRLAVSHDVRAAVTDAQAAELLGMRDRGVINDRTYLQLQLQLDREGSGRVAG